MSGEGCNPEGEIEVGSRVTYDDGTDICGTVFAIGSRGIHVRWDDDYDESQAYAVGELRLAETGAAAGSGTNALGESR